MGFQDFIPLLIIGVMFSLIVKYGWRLSWPIAILSFIPLINVIVIYIIGKSVHSRIDELEERLREVETHFSINKKD